MYIYNNELFKSLTKILGCPATWLIDACGVSKMTFWNYREKGNIPLWRLVRMCNYLHIPVSHFILPSSEDGSVKDASQYVVTGRWDDIELRLGDMADYFTIGRENTVNEAIDEMGVSLQFFYRNFRDAADTPPLSVTDYLYVCNKTKVYPGNFLVDYNRKITLCPDFFVRRKTAEDEMSIATRKIMELNKRNKTLQTKIAILQQRIAALEKSEK